MSDPGDVSLVLKTAEDLGTEQRAHSFVDVLERHGADWLPVRLGRSEPLRRKFDRGTFVATWMEKGGDQERGDFMYETSTKAGAFGWVEWRRAWNQTFNSILVSLPYRKYATGYAPAFLALASDLFVTFSGEHACIRSAAEHGAQHRPTGRGPFIGLDLSKYVPGVYYINFFGPALTQFFSEQRLQSCPAADKRRIGGAWMLATADGPADWNKPPVVSLKRQIREHLGARAFFDVDRPDRSTIAPFYDFTRTRIGDPPPRAPGRSAGEEFFASQDEVRQFVQDVLVWADRLRSRLRGAEELDFSSKSLRLVDDQVAPKERRGDPADRRSVVLETTAYFGEVLRRNLHGSWTIADADPWMPAIRLRDGEVEYPLVRAVKLYDGADRLADWFEFLARGGVELLRQ